MIGATIIIILYLLALILIFLYSLAQFNLLLNYLKEKKKQKQPITFHFPDTSKIPYVTIQLPIFNEMYVVERLLNKIAQLDYPKDKLEIQVLDDSTDESVETTAKQIVELQQTGLNILHIRREIRTGFKAGALKEGLKSAKGEFIAIFDADFLPQPDWLKKTIPYFSHDAVGVVQTRWGHINENYSLLTKIQAFALDAHFSLEQVGRNSNGHFINFNGTAGVWRKKCIIDAGNWEGDTLTEDLDLSYRAQLKKWKFVYLEDVATPAELPVVISAARSQQFRWNKGGAENFQKMKIKVLKSKEMDAKTKLHAFFHLLNSTMFLNVFIVSVLSVPILIIKNHHPELTPLFYVMGFFFTSTIIFFTCYWVAYKQNHGGGGVKNFIKFSGLFVAFISIALGFSWQNTVAVLEGHLGKSSDFIRTPKFNINSLTDSWKGKKYLKPTFSFNTIIEGILMLYFTFGLVSAFFVRNGNGDFSLFIFHLMLVIGFGYVFFQSVFSRN